MSGPKRRFLERTLHESATATFIAIDSIFIGDIEAKSQLVVFGEVRGDGNLGAGLLLSVTGRWHGNIKAKQAVVAGTIIGALDVADRLEIGYTAVIRGRVSARSIAIAKGAIVDGAIEVTSDAALVQFEERRKGFPSEAITGGVVESRLDGAQAGVDRLRGREPGTAERRR